jgi:pimeloyl-ACP methyl ester carboxylesterase
MSIARRANFARRWFERGLDFQMQEDSRTLLIAFGGLAQGLRGMPPFEFHGAARDIPVKRLFVRDPRQAWYHLGIFRYGRSFAALGDSLVELGKRWDLERIVTVGVSMGGYAALAFGTLLAADTVVAIAPQTVIDLDVMWAMDDHRYDRRLGELAAAGRLDRTWTDLSSALPRARHARGARTRYQIYYAERFRIDRLHAERLAEVPGVRLYRFGLGGHELALSLRDTGTLETMLRRALHCPLA